MPSAGAWPGSTTGVSGGGGDPRLARVVEFEAVDANRFTPCSPASSEPLLLGTWSEDDASLPDAAVDPGGGG